MDDENNLDLTDTSAPHDEISDKLRHFEAMSQVTQKIKAGIAFGATSGIKLYEFVKSRVSWKQRVLNFLKGD